MTTTNCKHNSVNPDKVAVVAEHFLSTYNRPHDAMARFRCLVLGQPVPCCPAVRSMDKRSPHRHDNYEDDAQKDHVGGGSIGSFGGKSITTRLFKRS